MRAHMAMNTQLQVISPLPPCVLAESRCAVLVYWPVCWYLDARTGPVPLFNPAITQQQTRNTTQTRNTATHTAKGDQTGMQRSSISQNGQAVVSLPKANAVKGP